MADGFLEDEEPAIAVVGGRYIIGQKLGAGAFGSVYQAQDLKRERCLVAIKTLDFADVPQHLSEQSWKSWPVMREIELLQSLESHPNICSVLDFVRGANGRRFHLVMELLRGPNLQYVLRKRGALECAEAATILRQCVSALAHLHERKIVHRDVKPSNIVLRDAVPNVRHSPLHKCRIQLVDFGLARLVPEQCLRSPGRKKPRDRTAAGKDGELHGSKEGSKHGGSESGGSKEGSKHGGDKFECSVHSSKLFAPPEFQEAWDASQSKILVTSAAAALIDVYSLGIVLEYMVLGARRDQRAAGRADGARGTGLGCLLCASLPRLVKLAPLRRTRAPQDLPPDLAQLIERMTAPVFVRAALREVAAHPWVRDGEDGDADGGSVTMGVRSAGSASDAPAPAA